MVLNILSFIRIQTFKAWRLLLQSTIKPKLSILMHHVVKDLLLFSLRAYLQTLFCKIFFSYVFYFIEKIRHVDYKWFALEYLFRYAKFIEWFLSDTKFSFYIINIKLKIVFPILIWNSGRQWNKGKTITTIKTWQLNLVNLDVK